MYKTSTTTGTGTKMETVTIPIVSIAPTECANRLPCGVCRLLLMMCPILYDTTVTATPTWSWTTTDVELNK